MDRILIFIFYGLLILIMYTDINKKIIPNSLNILVLILGIILKRNMMENFFIGVACYTLPILVFYAYVSDFLEKEVFGFGDIKLIMAVGGMLYNENINLFLQIYIFYLLMFLLALIYIIIYILVVYLRKKEVKLKGVELAFAPYICLSFITLFNYNYLLGIVYE